MPKHRFPSPGFGRPAGRNDRSGASTAHPGCSAGPRPADDVAITIYSSAAPGAVSPEYYRPLPGRVRPMRWRARYAWCVRSVT